MIDDVENIRNKMNFELRSLLSIVSMIDGLEYEYKNYEEGTLSEKDFLNQQLILITDIKTRLIDVFRD